MMKATAPITGGMICPPIDAVASTADGTPLDKPAFPGTPLTPESKNVLTSTVVSIVKASTRFASLVVLIALVLAVSAGFYTARHFAINTDINTLISQKMDLRQRDNPFGRAFDRDRTILAVVE